MKKYITVAALLAAGTAFANAQSEPTGDAVSAASTSVGISEVSTMSWESLESLTENSAYAYPGMAMGGVMIGEGVASFTADGVNSLLSSAVLYVAIQDADLASDITISFNLSGTEGVSYSYGFVGTNTQEFVTYGTGVAFDAATVVSGDVSVSDEVIAVSLPADRSSLVGAESTLAPDGVALFAIEFDSLPGSYAVAQISNISVAATAPVPEPSAFGLLAGIGALALVAARRRRKA